MCSTSETRSSIHYGEVAKTTYGGWRTNGREGGKNLPSFFSVIRWRRGRCSLFATPSTKFEQDYRGLPNGRLFLLVHYNVQVCPKLMLKLQRLHRSTVYDPPELLLELHRGSYQ